MPILKWIFSGIVGLQAVAAVVKGEMGNEFLPNQSSPLEVVLYPLPPNSLPTCILNTILTHMYPQDPSNPSGPLHYPIANPSSPLTSDLLVLVIYQMNNAKDFRGGTYTSSSSNMEDLMFMLCM